MTRHQWILPTTMVLLAPLLGGLGAAAAAENRPAAVHGRTLDRRDAERLEALARDYRIRVYLTFRQYRAEHDRRRAAWDRVEAEWKAAGSPADQFDKLIDWLSAATRASTTGSVGTLPELPRFDRPTVKQPIAKPPAVKLPTVEPPIAKPPVVKLPTLEPPVTKPPVVEPPIVKPPIVKPPTVEPPVAKPPVVEWPSAEPGQAPVRYAAPRPLLPGPAAGRLAVGESVLPPDISRRADVAVDGRSPVTVPTVELPAVTEVARRVVEGKPSSTPIPSNLPTLQPRPPLPELAHVAELVEPAGSRLQRSEQPTSADADDTAERRVAASQLPSVGAAEMVDRSVAAIEAKPRAAALAANRPHLAGPTLVDRPELAAARATLQPTLPETPPVVETVDRAEQPAAQPKVVEPDTPSKVNLHELAARIAGNNLAVSALESELDKEQTWTAQKLEPLLTRLQRLSVRTADLRLYEELVPEKDRWLVGRTESPQSLVSQLAARIVEARAHAASDQFAGSDADRASELDHLERLSRGLAELVGAK